MKSYLGYNSLVDIGRLTSKFKLAILPLALILAACTNDDEAYCYKGHDVQYVVNGSTYTTRICDEWRNPLGKYPDQPVSAPK
jgi:hypothetical protein